MKIYNKLVRDKIPQIIRADNKQCTTRVLTDVEYLCALKTKLTEEVAEFLQSESIEELADVVEVVRALVRAKGQTLELLESVRQSKLDRRGGFEKKLFLEAVSDDNE